MNKLKLNETPVRTSRNYNINNIKLENIEIPEDISKFDNAEITSTLSKVIINEQINNFDLTYGAGEILTNQVKNNANKSLKIEITSEQTSEIKIEFNFDNNNVNLVDNIEIVANENCKATVIIKYSAKENNKYYHNGVIKTVAKQNSHIKIILVNLLNQNSNNFISIDNTLEESAKVNYTIVDFGGKNSITNYYSNLIGDDSENTVDTIYLGKENQLFDLNYIGELRGSKSNINMEVQGALKDTAVKHFKGTIDFKKGCKKAKGNENEFCMLLSDKAKSLGLPMLLCSEEDVEGNHSSSAGKIGEKELFYIMSRGFELKDAMKLMVRAKFNKILENIENEYIRNEIKYEIDKRLD